MCTWGLQGRPGQAGEHTLVCRQSCAGTRRCLAEEMAVASTALGSSVALSCRHGVGHQEMSASSGKSRDQRCPTARAAALGSPCVGGNSGFSDGIAQPGLGFFSLLPLLRHRSHSDPTLTLPGVRQPRRAPPAQPH